VLFSVVVLLLLSGAVLLVVVVVESVEFCVTAGDGASDGDASGAGVVCVVVVVVVVSSLLPLHPTTIVPAMTVNPAAVANNIILFVIFIGANIAYSMIFVWGPILETSSGATTKIRFWLS
jgi:hypothetical protein